MSTSVSSVTKHFPSAQNGFTTTLASTISSGTATVPLNSVAGYTNGQTAVFVVDPSDTNKKQTFTGVIDTAGVQVTGVVWTAGTNQSHSGGATVVDYATATHISMITKGLLVEHNQDGTHGALTSTNATLTTPKIVTSINDSNGNEVLKTPATASAVNEFTATNAATGNAPALSVTGSDTNIDMNFISKGTGLFQFNSAYKSPFEIGRATLGVAGDTISISSMPARKYLRIFISVQGTGGTISFPLQFNGDTGANYATRSSTNGGADATSTSITSALITGAGTYTNLLFVGEVINIQAQEKLMLGWRFDPSTAGAGTAPQRSEFVIKWANTSAQITSLSVTNGGTGDFAIGSEIVVEGWN